jgi:hypothetical protein
MRVPALSGDNMRTRINTTGYRRRAVAAALLLVLAAWTSEAHAQRTLIIVVGVSDSAHAPVGSVAITARHGLATVLASGVTDLTGRAVLRVQDAPDDIEIIARKMATRRCHDFSGTHLRTRCVSTSG